MIGSASPVRVGKIGPFNRSTCFLIPVPSLHNGGKYSRGQNRSPRHFPHPSPIVDPDQDQQNGYLPHMRNQYMSHERPYNTEAAPHIPVALLLQTHHQDLYLLLRPELPLHYGR